MIKIWYYLVRLSNKNIIEALYGDIKSNDLYFYLKKVKYSIFRDSGNFELQKSINNETSIKIIKSHKQQDIIDQLNIEIKGDINESDNSK